MNKHKQINNEQQDKLIKDFYFNNELSNNIPPYSEVVVKHEPTLTKQWYNGIYSFNKNYIKNIVSVDNIVTKMLKSYFSINPLANNYNNKKTKLSIRRFKRLSLNKILASKPEIKHDNNKVLITIYLYNKKRNSILKSLGLKLKDLKLPFFSLGNSIAGPTSKLNKFKTKTRSVSKGYITRSKRALIPKTMRLKVFISNALKTRYRKVSMNNWLSKLPTIKKNEGKKSISTKNSVFKGLNTKKALKVRNELNSPVTISPLKAINISKNNMFSPKAKKQTKFAPYSKNTAYIGKNYIASKLNNTNKVTFLGSAAKRNKKYLMKSLVKNLNKAIFVVRKPINKDFRFYNVYWRFFKKKFLASKFSVRSYNLKAKKKYLNYKVLNNLANLAYINKGLAFKQQNNYKALLSNNITKKMLHSNNSRFQMINQYIIFNKALKDYYGLSRKYKLLGQVVSSPSTENLDNKSILINTLNKAKSNKLDFNDKVVKINPALKHISFANKGKFFINKLLKNNFSKNILKLKSIYKIFELQAEFTHAEKYIDVSVLNQKVFDADKSPVQALFDIKGKTLLLYSNSIMWNAYKLSKKTFSGNTISCLVASKKGKNLKKQDNEIFEKLNLISTLPLKEQLHIETSSNKEKQVSVLLEKPMSKNNQSAIALNQVASVYNKGKLHKGKFLRKNRFSFKTIIMHNCSWILKKIKKTVPFALRNNRNPKSKYTITYKLIRKDNFPINKKSLYSRNGATYQRASLLNRMRKIFLILHKMKKINQFSNKYKDILFKHVDGNPLNVSLGSNYTIDSFASNNDIRNLSIKHNMQLMFTFVKAILNKETLYLHYVKALSFNSTIFKSWFLKPLSNILSKIYNKKVVFNIVNLKYMHLNSDIFLQAIALRLRNSRKNRLNKVLRKALTLVKISKVNLYAQNDTSSVYKYVEQHFNNFKDLNRLIFKDKLGNLNNSVYSKAKDLSTVTPANNKAKAIMQGTSLKWLNHVQVSTINFIKYKSVFGIKLQASGRLTKRSTASRAVFKYRFKGGLKNKPEITRNNSTTLIKSNIISNLHYSSISSATRNGSFGLKTWINNN